jgi:hypothetical protein
MSGTPIAESSRWSGTPSPGLLRNPTSPRKRGEVKRAPRLHLSPLAGRGRIALAIRVRGSFSKRGDYRFKNTWHIAQDVVVPKSQDAIIVIDQPFVPNCVTWVIGVLASIHLDDKTVVAADKVDCVRTKRLLPDEFKTAQPSRPKLIPQSVLGVGSVSPQAPCASGFHLIGSAHAATPPHPAGFARRPLPARGERLASHVIR